MSFKQGRRQRGASRARSLRRASIALLLALAGCAAIFTPTGLGAAAVHPTVATGGISSLTPTSVILHGSLDAHGQPTNFVFQYGTTKGYGAQTPLSSGGASTSSVSVAVALAGLQPNTTYHYRIFATNAGGAVAGADRAFTTSKIPLSLQIVGAPDPVPFGSPLAVQGTLLGTNGGGRGVALQANPFPYTAGFATLGNPELTSASGAFSFPVVGLSANTQLRVVTTSAPFIASPVIVEGVAVRVTFHVQRVHRNRRGQFFRMYGSVIPAELGAHVGFQLVRGGAPSLNQGGAIITAGSPTVSRYSKIVRIRRRGVYEALVQVFDGAHVSAYSAPIRIR